MQGAELVAQGGYGCIFNPGLLCLGERIVPDGTITKMLSAASAENEMIIQSYLVHIDPEQKYYIYPELVCRPSNRYKKMLRLPKNVISKCTIDLDDEDARFLRYKFGGTSLYSLVLQPADYVDFFGNLGSLFDGLALLHSNPIEPIYHLDIKSDNIVCNADMKCRYIDFGISDTKNYKTSASVDVFYDTNIYPFDLRFFNGYSLFNPDGTTRERSDLVAEIDHKFWDEFSEDRYYFPRESVSPSTENMTSVNGAWVSDFQKKYKIGGNLIDFFKALELKIYTDFPEKADIGLRHMLFSRADVYALGKVLSRLWGRHTGVFKSYSHDHNGDVLFIYNRLGHRIPMRNGRYEKNGFLDTLLKPADREQLDWFLQLEHISEGVYKLVENMMSFDPYKRYSAEKAGVFYARISPLVKAHLTKENIEKFMTPYSAHLPYGDAPSAPAPGQAPKSIVFKNARGATARRVNKNRNNKSVRSVGKRNPKLAAENYSNPRYWRKFDD
jgi:serine/threonine protein kinase